MSRASESASDVVGVTVAPWTGPEPDAVARAWRLVLHRADEIADVISSRLLAKDLQAYRAISPHLPDDVRHSCREHIRRGLQNLSAVSPDTATAVELWRETGRRRARQGVPLELVLNAYTMGARVLWEALTETATTHGHVPDADLLGAARGVWANLDVQNGVLIEAYHRERDRVQRRDQQRQQTVLDGLVDGRGGDPSYAGGARAALGVAPDHAVSCVVVLAVGEATDVVGPVEDRLDRQGLVSHWHVRSGVAYGLVSGALPDEAVLVDLLGPVAAGRVAVAGSTGGVAGFGTAFQLVQDIIAQISVDVDAARLLTWRAADLIERGEPFGTAASKAKLFASEAAVRAANNAIQVHGGAGYVDDYPAAKYLRDARVMTLYEGTSQIQKLLIGRAETGISAFV